MSIRIEQLHVESVSRIFVTRIELDGVVTSRINEYINSYFRTGNGLEFISISEDSKQLSLKPASDEELGGIKVGEGLQIDSEGLLSLLPIDTYTSGEAITISDSAESSDRKVISVNRSTESDFGSIKLGRGLKRNSSGSTEVDFSLISKDINLEHGVIKLGKGLQLNSDKTTSVKTTDFVNELNGKGLIVNNGKLEVQIEDNRFNDESFTVRNSYDESHKIVSLNPATTSTLGGVRVGRNLIVDSDGTLHSEIDLGTIENLENKIKNLETENTKIKNDISAVVRLYTDLTLEVENLSKIVNDAQLGSTVHYYGSQFISGTTTFNGIKGTDIRFRNTLDNNTYKVYITTTVPTTGYLGELWIENKDENGFTIKTSGNLLNMQCDWIVFLDNTDTPEYNIVSFPFQKGTVDLNQKSGRYVPLENTFNDVDYTVFVSANENPNGYYGEVWVDNKTTNGFTIKTCGLSTTCDVDYFVIHNKANIYNEENNPFIMGQGTFNSYDGTTIRLPKELKTKHYQVLITPDADPEGRLGDIWIDNKTATSFTVHSTGSTNVKFNYLVLGK